MEKQFKSFFGYISRSSLATVVASLQQGLRGERRVAVNFTEQQVGILRQCQKAIEHVQERMVDVYDRGRAEQTLK
jgi:exonuclease VII small subunit